jgi:hypothetical protein
MKKLTPFFSMNSKISFRLNKSSKKSFEEYCRKKGLTKSEVLREIVQSSNLLVNHTINP